jgi:hypothetical protein
VENGLHNYGIVTYIRALRRMEAFACDQIKKDEIVVTCSTHGEMKYAYKMLIEKHENKRSLRRHSHRWKLVLRWFLRKYIVRVWIGLVWLRVGTSGGFV